MWHYKTVDVQSNQEFAGAVTPLNEHEGGAGGGGSGGKGGGWGVVGAHVELETITQADLPGFHQAA